MPIAKSSALQISLEGHSINVKGSHVDPKTGDYIFTGRSRTQRYTYTDLRTGKTQPFSTTVHETVRVTGKADSKGRLLVKFEDTEGGPEYFWVSPEQLGIQKP